MVQSELATLRANGKSTCVPRAEIGRKTGHRESGQAAVSETASLLGAFHTRHLRGALTQDGCPTAVASRGGLGALPSVRHVTPAGLCARRPRGRRAGECGQRRVGG